MVDCIRYVQILSQSTTLNNIFFPQCFVCVHSFLSLIAQSGSGVYSTLVREILKMCYLRIWQLCIVRCFAFTWPLFKGVMNLSFKSMCYCPTHNC